MHTTKGKMRNKRDISYELNAYYKFRRCTSLATMEIQCKIPTVTDFMLIIDLQMQLSYMNNGVYLMFRGTLGNWNNIKIRE